MASPGVDPAGDVEARTGFRPATALRPLAGFFAAGLGLSALYATTGVGLGCPFRTVTGWDCPLCGGTRMGSSLLHGDVAAAFGFNPVALVGLTLLGLMGVLWTVEAWGGPAARPPAGVRRRLARVAPQRWLVVCVALAVAYTVLRNLV